MIEDQAADRAKTIFMQQIPPGRVQLDPIMIATIISIILDIVVNLLKTCHQNPKQIRELCIQGGPLPRWRIRQIMRRSGDINHPYRDQIIETALILGSKASDEEIVQMKTIEE